MQRYATWLAGTVMALVAAGCGGDGTGKGGISPTGPLLVGSTRSVTVSCPAQIEVGQSGTCNAFGYDSIGTFTNSNESSWSSSNTSVVTVSSSGVLTGVGVGTASISAVIDGVTGSTTVTVVPSSPRVTISGPSTVRPNTTCEWVGSATGGTQPYSWDWSGGTPLYEEGEFYLARSGSSSFTISVVVTDANGRTGTASRSVGVSSNAPACQL